MKVIPIYAALLFVLIPVLLSGQWDSLRRTQIDTFTFGRKPYLLSEKLIIHESILVTDRNENTLKWQLDSLQRAIILSKDIYPLSDSFFVFYRYYEDFLPDSLGRSFKRGIDSKVSYITIDIPKNSENIPLIPRGLNYSGSFGRGLTAGNSQSLVLNSTFNMQLGGKIGDEIDIRAVISDANIPIQAEGTTQQLQEFDQVFIELSKDQQRLIAGDYRIERPEGYFLDYSKKLKGVYYENPTVYNEFGTAGMSGSFAISGGKFSRNQVEISEGNQGPYKLQGADNEQFIIVQSGSEKVYMDGELLVRGESNDYVIFYDRAEIIFTEKRPITKDVRIIVDFEYLVQNFARTITTLNGDWDRGKHQIGFRFYDESDSKNSSGLFELTLEDRTFLSNAGDDPANTLQNGIFSNPMFDQNGIFYEVDILMTGDTILTYSIDPQRAVFQAIFTDLGAGAGSYIIDPENNVNGRVYKYVGEGLGRYEPVRKLTTPERKQMYSLSDQYNYNKNGQIRMEGSISNFDKNLFSEIDQDDNISYAGRADWSHMLSFKRAVKVVERSELLSPSADTLDNSFGTKQIIFDTIKRSPSILKFVAYGEYLDRNFKFLNPFRNAEFNRDWNFINEGAIASEILGGVSTDFTYDCPGCRQKTNSIKYGFNNYTVGNLYRGNRHILQGELTSKSWMFRVNSSYLNSQSTEFSSQFLRPNMQIDRQFSKLGGIRLGVAYDGEYNNKVDSQTDTLLLGSNEYDVLKTFIRTDAGKNIETDIYYSKRIDRIALDNQQKVFSLADNYGANLTWTGNKQAVNINLNYRVLETDESLDQAVEDAQTVLGGIDYQYDLFKGIVKGVSNFNFNSGQEPKREFDFREVAPGEGNFVWIDNGDGIQDKNEFQAAPFSDQGNFIQISLFNNEFIQVYKQDYIQTLRIDPIQWKLSENRFKKSISRLSSQTSIRLTRKDLQDKGLPSLQFYVLDTEDEQLVSFVSSINQNLFWNRGNPAYDIIFNVLNNNTSLLLTTGNEIRSAEQYSLKYRQNILKKAEFEIFGANKKNGLRNINFDSNDYLIDSWIGRLSASYRYKQNIEFRLSSKYEDKRNGIGIETASSINAEVGLTFSNANKTRVDINASVNQINYLESNNPTIELIMLEGLKDGNNYLWECRFTKRLINNFDLTLNYNGRKTGSNRIVHVANAQIKATF